MDDVSYPLRILHRYLLNTFRYVSGEYRLNLFIFKTNYPIFFRYIWDTRDRRLRIRYRYLPDTFRYVSGEYRLNLFIFKTNYPILFRYIWDMRDRRWKTAMCGLSDVSIIFGRVNMSLHPVIWASSGLPPVKKKFRCQPCNLMILSF